MMTWSEFIRYTLTTTNKIEKVAVLTEDGQPVALTDDLQVSLLEGQSVVRCITDPAKNIAKLHIDNNFYTVFQGNNNTVVGTSPNRERVFVALKDKDAVVIAFGVSKGHGSFLYELKKNLLVKERRHFEQVPQVQPGGQSQIQQILQAAEMEKMAAKRETGNGGRSSAAETQRRTSQNSSRTSIAHDPAQIDVNVLSDSADDIQQEDIEMGDVFQGHVITADDQSLVQMTDI